MPIAQDWRARIWREFHAANLTRAYRDVLLTLATYRGRGGLICPTHDTLAARASCSSRTVRRALALAARLGLVSWSERRVRAAWRWLRTSNRYWLLMPGGDVQRGQRPPWPRPATTGQVARGEESLEKQDAPKGKKAALAELMAAAARLPDLLAQRRAAFSQGRAG
jgi:hypothetical protein